MHLGRIVMALMTKKWTKRDGGRQLARTGAGDIRIPAIFLTGYSGIPTSVRAMKAGAEEFLINPVDDQALVNAIQQAVEPDPVSFNLSEGMMRERLRPLPGSRVFSASPVFVLVGFSWTGLRSSHPSPGLGEIATGICGD
jgi:DNA-binding NarL/FixJ family response regulator